MKIFISLIILTTIAAGGFLIGRLTSQSSVGSAGNDLALANNSLINRFNKTVEKPPKPPELFRLTAETGQFLKLASDGRTLLYYLPQSGAIHSVAINPNGKTGPAQTIAQLKPNLKNLIWSHDGQKLIGDSAAVLTLYDLASGNSTQLDEHIQQPVFAPSGDRLAYLFFDQQTGTGQLRVGDARGEIFKNLLATRSTNWQIAWINEKTLALLNGDSLFHLDVATGGLQKVLEKKNDTAFPVSNCLRSIDKQTSYCLSGKNLTITNTGDSSATPKTIPLDQLVGAAVEPLLSGAEDYLIFRDSQSGQIFAKQLF